VDRLSYDSIADRLNTDPATNPVPEPVDPRAVGRWTGSAVREILCNPNALIPLSVDGMIVASSMTLLADSRAGRSGGVLPWTLLAAGSAASLVANVAAAEPTAYGRVIAAWPSFALIGAYELLMRQIRSQATAADHATACATTAGSDLAPSPPAQVRR